jgi:hypothetical protein
VVFPPIQPRPRWSEIMALAGYRTGSARPMCSPGRLGRPVRQLSCFVRHANGRSDRLTVRGGAAARTSLRDGRTTTIRAPDRAANPLYSPGLVRNERPSRTSAVQLREGSPGSRRACTPGAGRPTTELRRSGRRRRAYGVGRRPRSVTGPLVNASRSARAAPAGADVDPPVLHDLPQ